MLLQTIVRFRDVFLAFTTERYDKLMQSTLFFGLHLLKYGVYGTVKPG